MQSWKKWAMVAAVLAVFAVGYLVGQSDLGPREAKAGAFAVSMEKFSIPNSVTMVRFIDPEKGVACYGNYFDPWPGLSCVKY